MAYTSILTLTPYQGGAGTATVSFQPEAFGFSVEQTLNIGSQSTGAGAGKVTFNPFSITKLVDAYSPTLLLLCASGTPYQTALLALTAPGATHPFISYNLKLVAIKTISTSGSQHGGPLMETVTFEYGGLQIQTYVQRPDGTFAPIPIGWDRVKNLRDDGDGTIV